MPEFQFRRHWQTDSCFNLWALKSCLMPLSPEALPSVSGDGSDLECFTSSPGEISSRMTGFGHETGGQGKGEGGGWVLGPARCGSLVEGLLLA